MNLNFINRELLFPLLRVESESYNTEAMSGFVCSVLHAAKIPYILDPAGNIIAVKGTGEGPCVVAHMDTVHRPTGNTPLIVEHDGALAAINPTNMRQIGIGGDDKCGIYAALYILITQAGDGVAVFTVDEEVGCVGASLLDHEEIRHCTFLMQADRREGEDIVVKAAGSRICSKAFESQVMAIGKPLGYHACEFGSITDVQELVHSGVGISAVNIAAGYYLPHSDSEVIVLSDLDRCVDLMVQLWESKALRSRQWKFTPRFTYSTTPKVKVKCTAVPANEDPFWWDKPGEDELTILDDNDDASLFPDWEPGHEHY
jgi:putative aminopeptidase FrvX